MVVVGVTLVVLGITYVSWPPGHIPPYDANLVRLAESDLQGWCSGRAFWMSAGSGSASLASQCRHGFARQRSDRPNMLVVQRSFCEAIVERGWEGSVDDCLGIMTGSQYWPTYDGGITDQWNRARPYPRPAISGAGSSDVGSRTGDRQGNQRDSGPTHEVPSYGPGP